MPTRTQTHNDFVNTPFYWFARLERAVREGEHEDAARASRELRRLGVEVKYKQLTAETGEDSSRTPRRRKPASSGGALSTATG